VFAQSVAGIGTLSQSPFFVVRGTTNHYPGPGANIDSIISGKFVLNTDRNRVAGNRVRGSSNERPIGGVQILHPPAAAIGGQLALASADARVGFTVDLRIYVPTVRDTTYQDRLRAQWYDDWKTWRGHGIWTLLGFIPGRVDPHLGHPVKCLRSLTAVADRWDNRLGC